MEDGRYMNYDPDTKSPTLSFVIPAHNEAGSIKRLISEIVAVTQEHSYRYEIIIVEDGSSDNTFNILKTEAASNPTLKVIRFSRNQGQTAALSAGIHSATGDIIIPLDADLENSPSDIPRLLAEMNRGYDIVSGWRKTRWHGQWLTRKIPSLLANKLISFITRVPLHDYGCTLKAYRRESIRDLPLYGEMHRFIPAYAAWNGYRVVEIPVRYEPRKFGKSNYGVSRTFRVLLDLILLKFLFGYMNRPMHFFGGIGFIALIIGAVAGTVAILLRLIVGLHMVQTPLPVFSALFVIVGVQLIVMGVLAEMVMRVYYEGQQKPSYRIKETVNL